MPWVLWLVVCAAVWLAALLVICLLLTATKLADAQLATPTTTRRDAVFGAPPVYAAPGPRRRRIVATADGVREPPLAAPRLAVATEGHGDQPRPPASAAVDRSALPRASTPHRAADP